MSGWRTVVLDHAYDVSVKNHRLVLDYDEDTSIALEEIYIVFIHEQSVTMTAGAMVALAEENIPVLFCNRKYMPAAQSLGWEQHHEAAGALQDQAAWKQEDRARVWQRVVCMKILRQADLLVRLGLMPQANIPGRAYPFIPQEWEKREGFFAKYYFHTLFGEDFRRHADDNINAMLNYGYSIISSAVCRSIASHGYSTGLGIHHCSRDNPYNLAYDIVQPFRPFVDQIVYKRRSKDFDDECRKEMVMLLYKMCQYNGHSMVINTAIDMFVLDVLKSVPDRDHAIGEISFE